MERRNQWSAQVFYAKDIAAGANTVRATFGTAINGWGIVYAHEYSGLDRTNPLDVSRSAIGSAAAMTTGNATTTNANDLDLRGRGVDEHGHRGRRRPHHPLDRLRQPHDGPHRRRPPAATR